MSKCFLRLGIINNKLIVPFSLLILSIIHAFYINYILKNKPNVIITEISASIGHISIIIIPYIKCISFHKDKSKKFYEIKKNYIRDYSILLSTHLINLFLLFACSQLKPQSIKEKNILFLSSDIHKLYCIGSIEVIFIIIVSFFLLKYHYFIHHYLSLFLFIITSVVIDFMLDNFHYELNLKFLIYLIALLGQLLIESINLSYQKYMFDVLYYSPYRVCFAFGVLFLLYNIGTIVIFLVYHNYEFIDYFKNLSIGYETFIFISNIFMVFFLYISMALTNFYFTPSHIVVNNELANMIIFLLKSDSNIKYYSIFIFVFQFILFMIFLELLELDFCNLNEYTKRNIQIRAKNDMNREYYYSVCEIEPGYILEENFGKLDKEKPIGMK